MIVKPSSYEYRGTSCLFRSDHFPLIPSLHPAIFGGAYVVEQDSVSLNFFDALLSKNILILDYCKEFGQQARSKNMVVVLVGEFK